MTRRSTQSKHAQAGAAAAAPPPPAAACDLCSPPSLMPTLQAVDADPTAEALAGRAAVHNKLKNHMEAAADAARAAELAPGMAAAHREKG